MIFIKLDRSVNWKIMILFTLNRKSRWSEIYVKKASRWWIIDFSLIFFEWPKVSWYVDQANYTSLKPNFQTMSELENSKDWKSINPSETYTKWTKFRRLTKRNNDPIYLISLQRERRKTRGEGIDKRFSSFTQQFSFSFGNLMKSSKTVSAASQEITRTHRALHIITLITNI